jgi:hypothetical protein
MLGRRELAELDLEKKALLLESSLNRVTIRAEIRNLRAATAWMGEAASVSRELAPLLVFLAPLAGILMATGSLRAGAWISRAINLGKWVAKLYQLWRSFTARRREPEEQ